MRQAVFEIGVSRPDVSRPEDCCASRPAARTATVPPAAELMSTMRVGGFLIASFVLCRFRLPGPGVVRLRRAGRWLPRSRRQTGQLVDRGDVGGCFGVEDADGPGGGGEEEPSPEVTSRPAPLVRRAASAAACWAAVYWSLVTPGRSRNARKDATGRGQRRGGQRPIGEKAYPRYVFRPGRRLAGGPGSVPQKRGVFTSGGSLGRAAKPGGHPPYPSGHAQPAAGVLSFIPNGQWWQSRSPSTDPDGNRAWVLA